MHFIYWNISYITHSTNCIQLGVNNKWLIIVCWKHFPRYWPFVRGIHRFHHKGQWRGALIFSLICVWINGWVNNREAGDLRRYRAHYDVIVMYNKRSTIAQVDGHWLYNGWPCIGVILSCLPLWFNIVGMMKINPYHVNLAILANSYMNCNYTKLSIMTRAIFALHVH